MLMPDAGKKALAGSLGVAVDRLGKEQEFTTSFCDAVAVSAACVASLRQANNWFG